MSPAPVSNAMWLDFEILDGYRAEIIQEELVVTPAPSFGHTRLQLKLYDIFKPRVPDGYEFLFGCEWKFVERGIVAMAPIPDLLVIPRGIECIDDPPLLAGEVLSPSDFQRLSDGQGLRRIEGKRLDYARFGLVDYLEIDLTTKVPTAVRYELQGGELVEVDRAEGDKCLTADRPFIYELVPAELVKV
jgi:Uma2 family endonuclease